MRSEQRCLLIGNSRWHWAERIRSGAWSYSHSQPQLSLLACDPPLCAWAAVGPVPDHSMLIPDRCLGLDAIPLRNVPPWLGIDRALAGWGAWIQSDQVGSLMVVDAGTVLSLTRVSGEGGFNGGWLAAGLRLQLQAMAAGTQALTDPGDQMQDPSAGTPFPRKPCEAMRRGVIESLVGLIIRAQELDPSPLWLCGGDAPLLVQPLLSQGLEVNHAPDLVMQSLVKLVSPAPDRSALDRPLNRL
ncbi:type III pantothenate kinase [Synechococcus sp. MIT S9504]|uniref:type III pantothenate kinase n=1 Tax=Synechococcus sp. MIT S9504 TaxID=1801628 RepID=UPI0007BC12E4|nr:type III pantothenate kinase [Synechococcus sp. MIT S9504]KZR83478.1 Type III pantothenate kinase [Synechococcus sp. MIT S9504]